MRRIDEERIALGDRVRQRKIGNFERSDPEAAVILLDDMEFDRVFQIRFLQLAADEFGGERRRVKRHAEIGGEIGDRADMIFMRMRKDDRFEILGPVFDEFEVCEHQVDAGILPARKAHPQVDHQPPTLAAVEIDVHPDFARTAQGQEQQFVFGLEILLHEDARSASMARPSRVRSLSTASNRSVISSNSNARPPVATTRAGRPICVFIRATSPSISAT